jgi:hypothetical protein
MYERRLQILLDEGRYRRVAGEARSRGVSVAAVIREAIDQAYPAGSAKRSRAAERVLSAPDMPVPDPRGLLAELEDLRGRTS